MNVGTDPTTANEATDTQHDAIRQAVREQYGAVATATSLAPSASPTPQKSSACSPGCCGPSPGASLGLGYSEDDLAAVPEGANLGLGCGNPHAIAALSTGERVLDLGAGGGFDCFLAASRVGPSGRVVGVDMTAEMVAKARKNARALGLANVTFLLGEIEHLPVADASIDVILSNCVINLSPDKAAVFREAFRVLTPGGRLALSDVVALRPLPDALQHDLAALTGCVSGAASVDALTTYLAAAGFVDIRIRVNEASRVFIGDWLPGSGAEDYVASASIEARKTSEKGCCGPACCPKEAAP